MTSSQIDREPRLLPRLTSFRWYAALGVFLYHLDLQMSWAPLRVFDIGPAGVSFFFVLSGFVLTWSIGDDRSPWRFYRRRFARIYPAALVSGVAAAVLLAVGIAPQVRGGLVAALASLALVQAWFPRANYPVYSYNGVVWTLSAEAFFYALLPFLVRVTWRSRAVILAAIAALAAGLAATLPLYYAGHGHTAYNNPLIRLPEFTAGVALGLLVRRGWRPRLRLWQALAVLAICTAVAHHWPIIPLYDYVLLPGFLAVLISGIGSDLRRESGFFTTRLSVYLGELSFCFYLTHWLTIFVLMHETGWNSRRFTVLSGVAPALLFLGCSLASAVALRHAVELPMQRLLRPKPRLKPALTAHEAKSA